MSGRDGRENGAAGFRRGEYVTVAGIEEIMATLGSDAKCDGLPFMPEMTPFCGKTFRVRRRAERTCVEGIGMRAMKDTVFLEGLRCDGSAHDGCQRGCLFFWKEAWLKPADRSANDPACSTAAGDRETEPTQPRAAVLQLPTTKGDRFYCQSTELAAATTDLNQSKLWSYLHDMRIGELSLRRFGYFLWMAVTNRFCRLLFGRYCHQITGEQNRTLTEELNLQAGELVEIKNRAEIEATLDARGCNRGLAFEPEMALHCGRRYRVAGPLRKIILESSGKMVNLSNTVVLEGLVCEGICVHNCPRANHLYWREIWLRRV